MTISVGTFVLVRVNGEATSPLTVDDIRSQVSALLNQGTPQLTVRDAVVTTDSLIDNVLNGQWFHFQYQSTWTVQTTEEYAAAGDVTSIVVHACYLVTGILPVSFSETVSADWKPPAATTPPGVVDGLRSIFSGVQSDVQLLVWGLLILAVVLVIAAGWGKNVPAIVPHLA